jgi:hypothetical protein
MRLRSKEEGRYWKGEGGKQGEKAYWERRKKFLLLRVVAAASITSLAGIGVYEVHITGERRCFSLEPPSKIKGGRYVSMFLLHQSSTLQLQT